jgi:hypothetical protein
VNTIVYDAGALIAAESGVERMWALHQRALARGIQPVVPTTVMAEVWRAGLGQHRLAQFIRTCEVEPFSESSARTSGTLLAAAAHGVVDASVVECALRRSSPCVTGNRSHLSELAAPHRIKLIDI